MTDISESHEGREVRYQIADGQNTVVTVEPQSWRDEQQVLQAGLLDLSQRGVKLVLPTQLPPQGTFRLKFTVDEFGLQFYVAANVCWSQQQSNGQWRAGCALDPGVPVRLFDRLASDGRLDRRDAARHSKMITLGMRKKLHDGYEIVTLRDYSQGGFCIETATSVEPGDRVHLYLKEPELRMVIGEVQWQLKIDDAYLIGCRFANRADFARLQALTSFGAGL